VFSFAEHSAVDEEPRFIPHLWRTKGRAYSISFCCGQMQQVGVGHVAKSIHIATALDDPTPLTHVAERDLSAKPERRRLVCCFKSEESLCPSNQVGHQSTI
jgi:hypothetical protein